MKVIKLPSIEGLCNSYLVTQDGKEGILIDCASPDILQRTENLGVDVKTVLLTHGHFDHVGGCRAFAEAYAGIYCSEEEKPLIFSKEYLGIFGGVHVSRFEIDRELKDGDEFELCGLNIKTILTPGHTAGSVCYVIDDCLFTGDTLFCGSVGRWDLPTGNYKELSKSLERLKSLQGDYKIYSGHGEDTALSRERLTNPYLRY